MHRASPFGVSLGISKVEVESYLRYARSLELEREGLSTDNYLFVGFLSRHGRFGIVAIPMIMLFWNIQGLGDQVKRHMIISEST